MVPRGTSPARGQDIYQFLGRIKGFMPRIVIQKVSFSCGEYLES